MPILNHELRYLKHTKQQALFLLTSSMATHLTSFIDSDYVEPFDLKSTEGALHLMYSRHVS